MRRNMYFARAGVLLFLWGLMGCNQLTGINDFTFNGIDTSSSVVVGFDSTSDSDSDSDSGSDTETETQPAVCTSGAADHMECNAEGNVTSVDDCGEVVEVVEECGENIACENGACICEQGWSGSGCNRPVVYVNSAVENPNGNTGTSWEDAIANLQDALVMAGIKGECEIWVAKGTYTPGPNRESTFQMLENVHIYGGFSGTETTRNDRNFESNVTILSGDLNGDDGADFTGNEDNSYHVVSGADNAVLDGFTITAGNAVPVSESEIALDFAYGGGLYNQGVSPTIANCRIVKNHAQFGGGIANLDSNAIVNNCTIENNNASDIAAGVYNDGGAPQLVNCNIDYNFSVMEAGGMYNNNSSPVISNCSFAANAAQSGAGGGGLLSTSSSSPIIRDCIFSDNSSGSNGGAMTLESATATITNCQFRSNESSSNGGAIFISGSAVITNSTFFKNSTLGNGGAIQNFGSSTTIGNCSFLNNSAALGSAMYNGAGVDSSNVLRVANSIFWGNNDDSDGTNISNAAETNRTEISYSLVEGGCASIDFADCQDGNINEDPKFVNEGNGNLHLSEASRCIDAGNNLLIDKDSADLDGDLNTGEDTPFDLDGNPRIVDRQNNSATAIIDMGAYEFQLGD